MHWEVSTRPWIQGYCHRGGDSVIRAEAGTSLTIPGVRGDWHASSVVVPLDWNRKRNIEGRGRLDIDAELVFHANAHLLAHCHLHVFQRRGIAGDCQAVGSSLNAHLHFDFVAYGRVDVRSWRQYRELSMAQDERRQEPTHLRALQDSKVRLSCSWRAMGIRGGRSGPDFGFGHLQGIHCDPAGRKPGCRAEALPHKVSGVRD